MVTPERAVELLIKQAWSARGQGRYALSVAAAARAVRAAEQLGDTNLTIRAIATEAGALSMSGDYAAALARFTRILGMAGDPTVASRLDDLTARAVALAHTEWVTNALFLGGIPVDELFGVLDATDHWLIAIGRRNWRSSVMLERAMVYDWLGDFDSAIAFAQDALSNYHSDVPSHTLGAYRFLLGDYLRYGGRADEAEPYYQAILDDPTANAHDRRAAWRGLAWCALDRKDPGQALGYATAAVDIAEALGGNALNTALEVLAAAHQAAGDLETAWQVANRLLHVARGINVPVRLYYALRQAVDIAIHRADQGTAHILLDELDQHARALDKDSARGRFANDVATRRKRLTAN
jgi:tetratricopeptide (TPR) repeat protein